MVRVRHLQLTLLRAKNINASTTWKAQAMVFAKVSYKNIVYTTNKVEGMGQNPVWANDRTNEFHFDYTDESDHITLKLLNRKDFCFGESTLCFAELAHLLPGTSEEKTLPVMVSTPFIGSQKQFGDLVVLAQIVEQQVEGEIGTLNVILLKGYVEGITSIFAKTSEISAKLIYKHTTFISKVLKNMGNKFVWLEEDTFSFMLKSWKRDDALKLQVYNYQARVAECEMTISSFLDEVAGRLTYRQQFFARKAELFAMNGGAVGTIEMEFSYTIPSWKRDSISQAYPSTPHLHPQAHRYASVPNPSPSTAHFLPMQYVGPPGLFPPGSHLHPSTPSPELYPPGPHLYPSTSYKPLSLSPPEEYSTGLDLRPSTSFNPECSTTAYLHTSASDPSLFNPYSPSAPEFQEAHLSRGISDSVLLSLDHQKASDSMTGRDENSLYEEPGIAGLLKCYFP